MGSEQLFMGSYALMPLFAETYGRMGDTGDGASERPMNSGVCVGYAHPRGLCGKRLA